MPNSTFKMPNDGMFFSLLFGILNAKSVLWNFIKVKCPFWFLNAIIWHFKCQHLVLLKLSPGWAIKFELTSWRCSGPEGGSRRRGLQFPRSCCHVGSHPGSWGTPSNEDQSDGSRIVPMTCKKIKFSFMQWFKTCAPGANVATRVLRFAIL